MSALLAALGWGLLGLFSGFILGWFVGVGLTLRQFARLRRAGAFAGASDD